MNLELSDDEVTALSELLAARLGDMSAEIEATDNPVFRRQLRERRDLLSGVRKLLEG
ncbi:hypothetical protein HFP15_31280 [Amycolatopsis sp. K13G38]|uniref:50S ribosomal protein L29 n=1 Tax=Amycolatopsis acididurans TaxID=2724524 RepID=A0ABX1JC38_9PSEU|nr:hypothetical protein [Amycolatopsis acididurans]NKQ57357.1 hypothetical protein [Amycolatopsis acididurans]